MRMTDMVTIDTIVFEIVGGGGGGGLLNHYTKQAIYSNKVEV